MTFEKGGKIIFCYTYDLKSVPCHHSLVGPQVVVGGDGLLIWRVAANILIKQFQTVLRLGGVGHGADNSSP
jgi:hypothetical protein